MRYEVDNYYSLVGNYQVLLYPMIFSPLVEAIGVAVGEMNGSDVDVTSGIFVGVETSSLVRNTDEGIDDTVIKLELAGTLLDEMDNSGVDVTLGIFVDVKTSSLVTVDNILDDVESLGDAIMLEEDITLLEDVCNKQTVDFIIIIDDSTEEVGETESKQFKNFTSSINNSSSLRSDWILNIN